MSDNIQDSLQGLIDRESRKTHTHAVLLGVQSADGRIDFQGAAGDATPASSYFIASISKMYTVAVLMQFVDEGRLDLDALVTGYLPHDLLDGIHVFKGVDYSHQLKVYQLIHQTSGLADYFEGNLIDDFKQNRDRAYNVAETLAIARAQTPRFAPDSERKSYYSDTNYQLLGALIEAIARHPLAEVFQARIFDRLELAESHLFGTESSLDEVLPLYHNDQRLALPLAMASERGAGGIVSTLPDSLRFLRAYFDGALFDPAHFERMFHWNPLFFPMQYGYGLMRFKLPRWMTLLRDTPALIGHSGSSGSFAFYAPDEKLYLVGTFNQVDKPSRPFNFMLKVAAASKSRSRAI